MAVADRKDPYASYLFKIEIDGLTQAHFRECSGLSSSVEIVENPEGGMGHVSKIPGRVKFPNLVLKRGLTDSTELYDWHNAALQGQVVRKNGSVIQVDSTGQEKKRWNFVEGWPTKWDGPTFNASGNDLSVETLEIAHEGLAQA
jgi:phage tail-like protein